jgi:hypothetical protein
MGRKMANDATYKRWEELLNPKIVKERFAKAGLLIMAYEMLEEASLVGFEIFFATDSTKTVLLTVPSMTKCWRSTHRKRAISFVLH